VSKQKQATMITTCTSGIITASLGLKYKTKAYNIIQIKTSQMTTSPIFWLFTPIKLTFSHYRKEQHCSILTISCANSLMLLSLNLVTQAASYMQLFHTIFSVTL